MSRNKPLHDGSKFYDTRKCEPPGAGIPRRAYGVYDAGYFGIPHTCDSPEKYTAYWQGRLVRAFKYALPLSLPDHWETGYVLGHLVVDGVVGVVPFLSKGKPIIYGLGCTLEGIGFQNEPTKFRITSRGFRETMGSRVYRRGETGELLQLTDTYTGIMPIINYYANLLGKASHLLANNMVNSRMGYAVAAKNANVAAAIREIANAIEDERPPVAIDTYVADSKNVQSMESLQPWQNITGAVGQNFIAPEVQETLEKLWLSALRTLGVPTPYEKAEHTIGSENAMLTTAAGTVMDGCVEALTRSIERIKKLYPVEGLEIRKEESLYAGYAQPGSPDSGNAGRDGGAVPASQK